MDDAAPAPAGTRFVADPGLRRSEAGRVLIGGAPLRIIRLSDPGAAVVDAWLAGTPLADVKSARRLARRLLDAGMIHPVVAPRPPPPVTLVVPCRDNASGLDRCLAAWAGGPAVVVDDGSEDGAAVAATAAHHGARLVRREVNGGPAAARNEGLKHVATPLVAFLDTDVEPGPTWLDDLIAHFDDPEVVAVAPRVRSGPSPTFLGRYEEHHSPLDLGARPALVGPSRPVAYVPAAALVARVAALDAAGGFDSAMRVGEDVDLVWRVVAAGGTVRYEPAVEVVHAPRPTWRSWLRQRWYYGTSAAELAARHGSMVAPARCSVWSLLAWLAVAAGRPGIGLGIAAGSSAALVPKLDGLAEPVTEAARLAGTGHLLAGRGLARAVARVWWPVALLAVVARPRIRLALGAAVVVPPMVDWFRGARPADPLRSVATRIVDDVAYGTGVWTGVVRRRELTALTPDLVEWPGRRAAVEPDTVAVP